MSGEEPGAGRAGEAAGAAGGEAGGPPAPAQVLAALEACLFAGAGPLTAERLAVALRLEVATVEASLPLLAARLEERGAGVRLWQGAEGWQLRTDGRFGAYVAAIRGVRPVRLTRAALETLAVIAYRQPVAKGVIDEIRGVDCTGVLRMLLERGLVQPVGRSEEPGRPLAYGTTPHFLHSFGMRALSELPPLRDLRALGAEPGGAEPGGRGRV